jgi:hypothetical protein
MGRARRGRNHRIAAPASPETPSSPFLLQNQQDSLNHDVAPTAINDRLLQQYRREADGWSRRKPETQIAGGRRGVAPSNCRRATARFRPRAHSCEAHETDAKGRLKAYCFLPHNRTSVSQTTTPSRLIMSWRSRSSKVSGPTSFAVVIPDDSRKGSTLFTRPAR